MRGNKRLLVACVATMLLAIVWTFTLPASAERSKKETGTNSVKADDSSYKKTLINRFEDRDSQSVSGEKRDSSARIEGTDTAEVSASEEEDECNPDMPLWFKGRIDERDLLMQRAAQVARYRGVVPENPSQFDTT